MLSNEAVYLQSKEWQQKRLQRLCMDDFRCCRCGSIRNVQVHHLTYANIGNEDVANDLITLCDSCHVAIEKAPVVGAVYKKTISCGSNFGIKERIPLPAESALIYIDYRDLDPTKQIQLRSSTIRLCEAHIPTPDYYGDLKTYQEDVKEGLSVKPYEDYQFVSEKRWSIFVEKGKWVHEVPSNVIIKGEIRVLQNGLSVLHVDNSLAWEGYQSIEKQTYDQFSMLLDKLQDNYLSFVK